MKLSASTVLLAFLVVSAVYMDPAAAFKKKLRAILAGAMLAAKPKFLPLPLPVCSNKIIYLNLRYLTQSVFVLFISCSDSYPNSTEI